MKIDLWILGFSAVTVIATIWMGFWAAGRSRTASDFFVAGLVFGKATLGAYTLAWQFASIPIEKLDKMMRRSKVQAEEVARAAITACDRGQLHVFPHTEAKITATLKRIAPEGFHRRLIPMLSRFSGR